MSMSSGGVPLTSSANRTPNTGVGTSIPQQSAWHRVRPKPEAGAAMMPPAAMAIAMALTIADFKSMRFATAL